MNRLLNLFSKVASSVVVIKALVLTPSWMGSLKYPRTLLTLKLPITTHCRLLCHLFVILKVFLQTMWTQIRLLLEEQSDQGPYCLPVCKNRFEKFAKIFSRRHKQTFSNQVFLAFSELILKAPIKTAVDDILIFTYFFLLFYYYFFYFFIFLSAIFFFVLKCRLKMYLKRNNFTLI